MEPFTELTAMHPAEMVVVKKNLKPLEIMILEIGKADLSRGVARIDRGRCFWLKDGRRVSIQTVPGGGYSAGTSSIPHPNAPASGTYK